MFTRSVQQCHRGHAMHGRRSGVSAARSLEEASLHEPWMQEAIEAFGNDARVLQQCHMIRRVGLSRRAKDTTSTYFGV